MKKSLLFIIVYCLVCLPASSQVTVNRIEMLVSNVCEYAGQLVVNNSSDSLFVSPSLGKGGCISASSYIHEDSIALSEIRFLELSDDGGTYPMDRPFFIGNSDTVFSYFMHFPNNCYQNILPRDTLLISGIKQFKYSSGRVGIIRENNQLNNLIILDTTGYDTVLIQTLAITPHLLLLDYQFATVIGTDLNNDIRINVVEISNGLLVESAVLPVESHNPLAMIRFGQNIYLASAPGDTAVYITYYFSSSNASGTEGIYSGSGTHAYEWEGTFFHFQPETDVSGSGLDTQVIIYDAYNFQQEYISNIGRRLHKLIYSGGGPFSFTPSMHGVEESGFNNKVYVYTAMYYNPVDSFIATSRVDFIESDLRCNVGLNEYDDDKVKIHAFPNPAGTMITVNISGLICGRDYKMDILDMQGKQLYENTIHAKMLLDIPLESFPQGNYLINIHTKKGIVSERFIKQ